jgi:hypothetical protein
MGPNENYSVVMQLEILNIAEANGRIQFIQICTKKKKQSRSIDGEYT